MQSSARTQSFSPTLLLPLVVSLIFAGCGIYQASQHEHIDQQPATIQIKPVTELLKTPHEAIEPLPDFTIPPIVNGLAPVLTTIPTTHPVVFLGIDDGHAKLPFDLPLMQADHIKASLYLADSAIKENPAFFKSFITAGSLVENHTVTHPNLSRMTYAQQKQEICGEADIQQEQFGRRPILFRPPGGDYNQNTRRAAADCGMKAIVLWIAKANGGSMQYQVGASLRPGDIVLMHFRSEFAQDLQAFTTAEHAAGLHTVLLEDWLSQDPQ